jgi:hypothetical protein
MDRLEELLGRGTDLVTNPELLAEAQVRPSELPSILLVITAYGGGK